MRVTARSVRHGVDLRYGWSAWQLKSASRRLRSVLVYTGNDPSYAVLFDGHQIAP